MSSADVKRVTVDGVTWERDTMARGWCTRTGTSPWDYPIIVGSASVGHDAALDRVWALEQELAQFHALAQREDTAPPDGLDEVVEWIVALADPGNWPGIAYDSATTRTVARRRIRAALDAARAHAGEAGNG